MKSETWDRESGSDRGAGALDGGLQGDPLVESVEHWIDAWNWRQTSELVDMADPEIELHPLRLRGLSPAYHGHDGLQTWMGTINREGHNHRISPESVRRIGDGRVLAVGTVSINGHTTTPFSGVYEFDHGRIRLMAHYFTPVSVLESIGVLDPGMGHA
jgi:hypothetical protein